MQKLKEYFRRNKKKEVVHHKLNDYDRRDRDRDQSCWYYPMGEQFAGHFSAGLVHSNTPSEDRCHIEIGRGMTFTGIYDGHGGPEVAQLLRKILLDNILESADKTSGSFTPEVFFESFAKTDREVMEFIHRNIKENAGLRLAGSCCLVAIILSKTLYIANLGDSRAVLGYRNETNDVVAEQLTRDHNTCRLEVRQELRSKYPDVDDIVAFERGCWRLKGMVQVSRAFGNYRLKATDPSEGPSFISTEPSVYIREIKRRDKFVILASDGLWDKISCQDAVAIVNTYPKEGIAGRLISEALNVAFYDESCQKYVTCCTWIRSQMRRNLHDDITVVVLFLDSDKIFSDVCSSSLQEITLQGLNGQHPSNKLRGYK